MTFTFLICMLTEFGSLFFLSEPPQNEGSVASGSLSSLPFNMALQMLSLWFLSIAMRVWSLCGIRRFSSSAAWGQWPAKQDPRSSCVVQSDIPSKPSFFSLPWIFFSLLPLQVSSSGRLPWFPSLNRVPCSSDHHRFLFDSSLHDVTQGLFNVCLPTGSQETSLAFCYCCFLVWLSFCFSFFTKTLFNANTEWVINTSSPNWWITCSKDSSKLGPLDMFTRRSL